MVFCWWLIILSTSSSTDPLLRGVAVVLLCSNCRLSICFRNRLAHTRGSDLSWGNDRQRRNICQLIYQLQ